MLFKLKIWSENMKKRIALIASIESSLTISDDRIFKDVCLIPILMKEKYDFEASIVNYGINKKLVNEFFPGVECVNVRKTGNYILDINDYLEENAKNIDIAYLFGPYKTYDIISKLYKMYNPNGKIYLKLDMNRYWLQRLVNNNYFKNLLEISDLITVEDKKLQNMINMICNSEVEYLRNGYYEFFDIPKVNYEEKKNVILSVGRLGTEQKRTDVLIEAFLKADLSNWELHLIGGVESEFLPVLDKYKENPKFLKQVKLLGRIEPKDKKNLYDEYRQAKIFCMTSQMEACAHVYSEASSNGCYIVSTDVDGISDISEYSTIVPINDIDGVAKAFENASKNEELMKKNCYKLQEYVRNEGMWDFIIGKLYLMFCSKGLIDETETNSSEKHTQNIIEIPHIVQKIQNLYKKFLDEDDYNYIIDLSGEIIEYLNNLLVIINENNNCILDMSIKNETILLKEYFINYINGILNGSDYVVKKYENNIYNKYYAWSKKILNSINFN